MMEDFFDRAANSEYGFILSVVVVAALMFGVYSLNGRKKFTAISYIIAVVLVALLSYQLSRLVGAFDYYGASSDIDDVIGAVSPSLRKYVSVSHNIGWYIFRRIFWSVVFLAIGGFGILFTMETEARNPRRRGRSGRRRSDRSYDSDF